METVFFFKLLKRTQCGSGVEEGQLSMGKYIWPLSITSKESKLSPSLPVQRHRTVPEGAALASHGGGKSPGLHAVSKDQQGAATVS